MIKLLRKLFGFSITVHTVPDEKYNYDSKSWSCRDKYYVVKKYFWICTDIYSFMTKEAADKYKTYLENL